MRGFVCVQVERLAFRPVHRRRLRGLPAFLQETRKPLNDLANIPFLVLILPECDDARVEAALLESILQLIELVLVFVKRELLYLRRRVQRLNKLLKLAALECLTSQEVNAHERLCPAFALAQFVGSRNRLLDDLEGMSAISNSEFGFAIFKILEFLRVDVGNCYPQRLILNIYLEFIAKVNDSSILSMEGRWAVFDRRSPCRGMVFFSRMLV